MSIQFAEPVIENKAILGALRPALDDQFPEIEMLAAAGRMKEEFTKQANTGVSFQLMAGGEGPESRFWLESADTSEVLQVQGDRLSYNWRRVDGQAPAPYPRYEQLRVNLSDILQKLTEAVEPSDGAAFPVDWCEISYLNSLPTRDENGDRLDLSRYLKRIAPEKLSLLPEAEDSSFHERYPLVRDGEPIGRLIVNVTPVFSPVSPNEEMHLLRLTARGLAPSADLQGALAFLDYGRKVIVTTFRDLTTDEMHEKWGLQ